MPGLEAPPYLDAVETSLRTTSHGHVLQCDKRKAAAAHEEGAHKEAPAAKVGRKAAARAPDPADEGDLEAPPARRCTREFVARRATFRTRRQQRRHETPTESLVDLAKSLGIPEEAMPDEHAMGGKSYTLHAWSSAVVEVHLARGAFWVKRHATQEREAQDIDDKGNKLPRNISWAKYGGPQMAWDAAKLRTGFDCKWG